MVRATGAACTRTCSRPSRAASTARISRTSTSPSEPMPHRARYSGQLAVGQRRFPVTLQITHAHIELERYPLVWAFYLPREIARVHGLPDGNSRELVAKEREYHDLFRAHGVLLASDLSPAAFVARRSFVYDVKYWPVAVDVSSDKAIERDVSLWLKLFRDTGVTPFAIPVDEPGTNADKLRAKHIADVIGSAGGGRPLLLRGVTDVAAPIYGDSFDLFISPENLPQMRDQRAHSGNASGPTTDDRPEPAA